MTLSPELRTALLRAAILFVPLGLATATALRRRPSRREWGGVVVASVWTFVSITGLNVVAGELGLWTFEASGGTHRGIPVDVLVGWTALWGVAFPLALGRAPLVAGAAVALWIDVLTMPLATPLIALGPGWGWGEAAALVLCFLPAQLAYRWTRDERCLEARVMLQVIAFGGASFWLLGDIAAVTADAPSRPGWWLRPVHPSLLAWAALSAMLSVSAVHELVSRGSGTPLPWDPPRRLVVSGLYRYVRNPMQLGMWIALPAVGFAYANGWLVAGAGALIAFSGGLARWHETVEFEPRHGDAGARFRAGVRWGLPRLLPYVPERATLYYGAGCGVCEGVARWIRERHPRGLDLVPAQEHPDRDLSRLTYRHADGREEEGVAALARAWEHVHLAGAIFGSFARLPLIRPVVQLLIDAAGGGPRLIPRIRDRG